MSLHLSFLILSVLLYSVIPSELRKWIRTKVSKLMVKTVKLLPSKYCIQFQLKTSHWTLWKLLDEKSSLRSLAVSTTDLSGSKTDCECLLSDYWLRMHAFQFLNLWRTINASVCLICFTFQVWLIEETFRLTFLHIMPTLQCYSVIVLYMLYKLRLS